MRPLLLFCFMGIAISTPTLAEPISNFGYHERVGIPLATRIREVEDKASADRKSDHEDIKIAKSAIAPIGAHPYLAGLIINLEDTAMTSVCGSSLLSHNRLVTAAHCWFDGVDKANNITVVLGSNMLYYGGYFTTTNVVITHPDWRPRDGKIARNDIAMIYLPYSIKFSSTIQPIAIPSGRDVNNQFEGEWAVAAGFGITSDYQNGVSHDTVLRHVFLQVMPVWQCRATMGSIMTKSIICTKGYWGEGTAGGDSGGPLVVNINGQHVLIGITSFGAPAVYREPSAFTRVTSFRNFILQHM